MNDSDITLRSDELRTVVKLLTMYLSKRSMPYKTECAPFGKKKKKKI